MSAAPARDSARSDDLQPPIAHVVESARYEVPASAPLRRQWGARGYYRHHDFYPPPSQTIIIWGDRDRLPETKPKIVPSHVVFVAKIAAFVAICAGVYWGPPYWTCRDMKERGLFYYGTTVSTCMQERIAQRTNPFEAISKHIIPALR